MHGRLIRILRIFNASATTLSASLPPIAMWPLPPSVLRVSDRVEGTLSRKEAPGLPKPAGMVYG